MRTDCKLDSKYKKVTFLQKYKCQNSREIWCIYFVFLKKPGFRSFSNNEKVVVALGKSRF